MIIIVKILQNVFETVCTKQIYCQTVSNAFKMIQNEHEQHTMIPGAVPVEHSLSSAWPVGAY